MLSLDEILRLLDDRNLAVVSKALGMRYATLYNIAKRITKNPSYETLKALSDYLS